ncbi:MAG TPA: PIN domain-containing protein, partial [Terriglobales bacterium]|nr:PIN domain-containing protein [Terriglobales bacterium]
LTDLILCEVLQGIRDSRTLAQVRDDLLQFEVFHSGGTELAIAAAQNFQILRARGHTIRKTIDCLIATFCLEAGHELLHRDRDFDVFEKELGLRVVHA